MKIDNKTRLFYVVDSIDDNEELYTTEEDALDAYKKIYNDTPENKPRLYIAEVRNAYYEKDIKAWNYEDCSDTFTNLLDINVELHNE